MSAGAALLELRGLTRQFGGVLAVNRLDLDVAPGEVVGLIGPNGAGKTTAFHLIAGFHAPTPGTVRFKGESRGWDSSPTRSVGAAWRARSSSSSRSPGSPPSRT